MTKKGTTSLTPEELIERAQSHGYRKVRVLNDNFTVVGLHVFARSVGLVIGIDVDGYYDRRYNYPTDQYPEAVQAFLNYNDTEDHPEGPWTELDQAAPIQKARTPSLAETLYREAMAR